MQKFNFNMELTEINQDLFRKLCVPTSYSISYPVVRQARKHKKRRINKKWLKRYGYVCEMKETDGWVLEMRTDGTYEFKKEINEK